ncbi:MAG: flavodoxin [Clostridiales bacterium]|nr:flavodoxin [Clostridiales bacterium]
MNEWIIKKFGGIKMNTLVIYASKHGTAKKCASEVSQRLTGKVDLCNIKSGKLPELSQYERVIIGGSIYVGKIQKDISDFCLNNLGLLKQKKLGLYLCCSNKKEFDTELKNAFPQELISTAAAVENFGGEFNFKEMNFLERAAIKMVSKGMAKEDPSMAQMDMKKSVSMLLQDNIDRFIELMNNVIEAQGLGVDVVSQTTVTSKV